MLDVFMTPGHEVELIPKGYTVRCIVVLDEYPNMTTPVELGVFTEDMKTMMMEVMEKLTESIGPQFRSDAYAAAKQLDASWPVNSNGVPAWLKGYALIFHNGEGRKYNMTIEEKSDG